MLQQLRSNDLYSRLPTHPHARTHTHTHAHIHYRVHYRTYLLMILFLIRFFDRFVIFVSFYGSVLITSTLDVSLQTFYACQHSISNASTTRFWVKQRKERKRVCMHVSCPPKGSGICGHNIPIHIKSRSDSGEGLKSTPSSLFSFCFTLSSPFEKALMCVWCAFDHVPLREVPVPTSIDR